MTTILQPGQQGTTSGFPATVVRHYDGNMYEVRLASGLVCIDASDFIPAGNSYPQWVVLVNPGKANEITDGAFHRYNAAADRRDALTRDGEEADIAQQDNEGNLTFDF